ncbi:hypothetical protein [Sulfurovum sp.]|uniref:hypothetical protein n=1 Tax=Sulfurovum sp. TaxID=1969726 RepID=UPI0028680D71|nr:hypothetical protein [Sulfurovum sp.]
MNEKLYLYAIYLTKSLTNTEIEQALNVKLTKGIESMLYAQIDKSMITYTNFNVLTLINWSKEDIPNVLHLLGIKESANIASTQNIYQDYPIEISPHLNTLFEIDNQKITLKERSTISLLIISHVISQSVAL